MGNHNENVPTGAICKTHKSDVERLFDSVWAGLAKKLTTSEANYEFLRCFVYASGLTYEWQGEGIWVKDPGIESSNADTAALVPTEQDAGDDDGDTGVEIQ